MNKTKIDWVDFSWNPVVGCRHGCEYCYARNIARRFASKNPGDDCTQPGSGLHEVRYKRNGSAYRYGFEPTLYSYRLGEPERLQAIQKHKSSKIFVCSMADLFGEWVPDEWIKQVFDACVRAPKHTYFFLTKNPQRYIDLENLPADARRWWWGHSTDGQSYNGATCFRTENMGGSRQKRFVSVEPFIHGPLLWPFGSATFPDWVIVGAQTQPLRLPKREWVLDIREKCKQYDIPLFEKSSLGALNLPGGLIRQWPDLSVRGV